MPVKVFFFDCETTGLDPKLNAIHQLSGAIMINGEVKERFNYKIKPFTGAIIDDAAMKISGVEISDLHFFDEEYTVYANLIGMISKYVDRFDKKG